MTIAEMMLAEFEQEARTTRRFLERLSDDKLTWQPHPKSMSAGQLALHIAGTPGHVVKMVVEDEVPMPDMSRPRPQPASMREVLETLETSIATVKQVLPTFTDERMGAIWRMIREGKAVLAIPRAAMLRNILLNHWYHHRGQFGVYLRLLGASVPSSYGPSGDELPDFVK